MNLQSHKQTHIGTICIEEIDNEVISIKFVQPHKDSINSLLAEKAFSQLEDYLQGNLYQFSFPYKLIGTSFQHKVWNSLLQIPYGQTTSYKDIAIKIGMPKAYRAVGLANNKNPLMIVVPCHRVIGVNGKLVGYAAGTHIKQQLLQLEQVGYNS